MQINLIAAVARNRAIGFENKLLYWLPNDLKRFRQLTTGKTVVMGRKSFESLPNGALPNRRNIVLSRREISFPGCECCHSVEEVLQCCKDDEEVFFIGGAEIFGLILPRAHRLLLTEIDDVPAEADAFFPEYDDWREVRREEHGKDDKHAFNYAFVDYER